MGWFNRLIYGSTTATICGHTTDLKGPVTAFGREITIRIRRDRDGTTIYCLDCLAKMAIRCAWCGEPILIGDRITLYSPRAIEKFNELWARNTRLELQDHESGLRMPKEAVVYKMEKGFPFVVGCLSISCADTGADTGGYWMPGPDGKGMVVRTPTAYEILMANPDAEYLHMKV